MATTIPKRVILPGIVRGDIWPGFTATFNKSGFDFTGCTASAQLRCLPDSDVLADLTASIAFPVLGQMSVTVSASGSTTSTFPIGTIYGDVELSRVSPAFGPKTWFRFQFDVVGDYTHA